MSAKDPWVLGIGASHNGAACLLHGDEIVAAVQEERLVRQKRAFVGGSIPHLCVTYCLDAAGIGAAQLDMVVVSTVSHSSMPLQDLTLNPALRVSHHHTRHAAISHHLGHALSAYAVSGHPESATLVIDGIGSPREDLSPDECAAIHHEVDDGWEHASIYHGQGPGMRPVEKHLVGNARMLYELDTGDALVYDPFTTGLRRLAPERAMRALRTGMPGFGTIGGMYSAVSHQIFGHIMNGPGKVMGLAPYGKAVIPVEDFFTVSAGRFVFSEKVPRRFQHDDRWPEHADEYADLAASVQVALEEAVLHLARHARARTGSRRLCYAGGVALNSVANERIIREAGFEDVFVMPPAEDSGTAVGAAYWGLWQLTGRAATTRMARDAVGRAYPVAEIDAAADAVRPVVDVTRPADVIADAVDWLVTGKPLGWFQGRAELGPRALGQRSILCDPRDAAAKSLLNEKVKFREEFRPYAPVILREEAEAWFAPSGVDLDSPFMLRVREFRPDKRHEVPAVVHVDGSGRLQTVSADADPMLRELLSAFFARTGVPILLNTSFNTAGEPIVETPDDAIWTMLRSGLDAVVLGDRFVTKSPDHSSPLDLYVALRALSAKMTLSVTTPDGAPGFSLADLLVIGPAVDAVQLTCPTPWGTTTQAVDGSALPVLALIDGSRTGWQILDQLGRQRDDPRARRRLLGHLTELRRMAAVSFHGTPVPGARLELPPPARFTRGADQNGYQS